jgi:hypothetical protein
VGKPEEKKSLGRSRRGWEYNIKMDVKMEYVFVDWIDLARDRKQWRTLENPVMILRVPSNAGIFLSR